MSCNQSINELQIENFVRRGKNKRGVIGCHLFKTNSQSCNTFASSHLLFDPHVGFEFLFAIWSFNNCFHTLRSAKQALSMPHCALFLPSFQILLYGTVKRFLAQKERVSSGFSLDVAKSYRTLQLSNFIHKRANLCFQRGPI